FRSAYSIDAMEKGHSTLNAQRPTPNVKFRCLSVRRSILGVGRFLRWRPNTRSDKLRRLLLARQRGAEFFHPRRKSVAVLLPSHHGLAGNPIKLNHASRT